MSDISLKDGTLILNGVVMEGFGDSENALDFPNVDVAAMRRGADGSFVSGSTGNVGGPMTLTLLQNSPAMKVLMGLAQAQKLGVAVELIGLYRHEVQGITLILTGGVLTNVPTGPTLGTGAPPSKTFTIEFGRIDNDYTLANT
jgi:hypothetical protein